MHKIETSMIGVVFLHLYKLKKKTLSLFVYVLFVTCSSSTNLVEQSSNPFHWVDTGAESRRCLPIIGPRKVSDEQIVSRNDWNFVDGFTLKIIHRLSSLERLSFKFLTWNHHLWETTCRKTINLLNGKLPQCCFGWQAYWTTGMYLRNVSQNKILSGANVWQSNNVEYI